MNKPENASRAKKKKTKADAALNTFVKLRQTARLKLFLLKYAGTLRAGRLPFIAPQIRIF